MVTVANPSVPIIDNTLLKDIPEDLKNYKARTLEPSYKQKAGLAIPEGRSFRSIIKVVIKKAMLNILLPDVQVLWWPGLVTSIIKILRQEHPSCIFVTAPPFSSFLPAVLLGNIYRVQVLIDFRDEWVFSRNHLENMTKSPAAKKMDYIFEKYVVSHCAMLTAATESYIKDIIERYSLKDRGKGVCITNGFDEEDIPAYQRECSAAQDRKSIHIVYSGTVWKATSLEKFVLALEEMVKRDSSVRELVKVKVFGRIVPSEMDYFQNNSIKDMIEICGYIEHDKLMSELLDADVLLLSLSNQPGSHKIIPGKTFEYMATGKHILAIVPESEVRQVLLKNYDNFTVVFPDSSEDIADALANLLHTFEDIRHKKGKDVSQFSRKKLTEKLANVFDKVTENLA